MKKRSSVILAVVLSFCLLILCLSPVIGCCHNCNDDDCAICRAVCAVSNLFKTAGLFPFTAAAAAYLIIEQIKSEHSAVTVTASSPVELHTVILS